MTTSPSTAWHEAVLLTLKRNASPNALPGPADMKYTCVRIPFVFIYAINVCDDPLVCVFSHTYFTNPFHNLIPVLVYRWDTDI